MPAPSNDAGRADPRDPGSEQRLLNQVRRGSPSAVEALLRDNAPWLRRRAGNLDERSGAGRAASHLRAAQMAPSTLLVTDGAETQADGFSAPQAGFTPLPRQTAIVHLLETGGGPVRVEPDGRPSVFPLLPPDEAAWVAETGADVIVPVPGPGTDVLGVLVVGRRRVGPGAPAAARRAGRGAGVGHGRR